MGQIDAANREDQGGSFANRSKDEIHRLAPSVHYLETIFMQEVRETQGVSENSEIHSVVDAIIRNVTKDCICPIDGQPGSAYAHRADLQEDHVGVATIFLSYTWFVSIKLLIDSVVDYCNEKGFDTKRTYIWICYFCTNQHRIGQVLNVNFKDDIAYMKRMMSGCTEVICLLDSWRDPTYLKRLWTISELFIAVVKGFRINFILPSSERFKLINEISNTGYNNALQSLPSFDVEKGTASFENDRENLIQYIKSEHKPGIQDFNAKVNEFMEAYVTHEYNKQCKIVQKHHTGGNSDNPRNAVDRLDYGTYAKAIVSVVREIEDKNSNLCVALMAPWGVGKTMLWLRIRDRLVTCDKEALVECKRNLVENFTEGYSKANKAAFLALRDVCQHVDSSIPCIITGAQRYETICLLIVLPLLIAILPTAIYFLFMSKSVSAWLLLPYFILGIIEVVIFLALLIMNYHRPSMRNYGNSDILELTTSIQVLRILKGERGLTYRFSPGEQLSLLACVRILVLLCVQVLVQIGYGLVNLMLFTISHLGPIILGTSTETSPQVDRRGDFQDVLSTTHIFVEFNAWEYNGSENLWASIMDKLWNEVEKQYRPASVRLHRVSIELSQADVLPDDTFEIREQKRQKALIRYYIRWCLSVGIFVSSVVCFVVYYPRNENVDHIDRDQGSSSQTPSQAPSQEEAPTDNVSDLVMKVLTTFGISGGTVQFAVTITSFCIKILPKLRNNPFGALIKESKKMGAENQRYDFSAHFGFMGKVRHEVGHLYDFLQNNPICEDCGIERSARLSIFVDDLDRCEPQAIVDVLRAVQLLLEDPNEENEIVTTWLAIDSRIIVSSINQIYKSVLDDAQLDGDNYLEKMVNVPFSIPEMTNDKKTSYLDNLFLSGKVALSRLRELILSQQGSNIVHAAYVRLSDNQKELYPDLEFLLEKKPFSAIEMKSSIKEHYTSLVNGFSSVRKNSKTSPNIKMILPVDVANNRDDVNITSENIKSLQRTAEEYLQVINRQVFYAGAQSREAVVPTPEFKVGSENSPEFTNENDNLEQRSLQEQNHQTLSDVGDAQESKVGDIENPSDHKSTVIETSTRTKTEQENSASMMTPDERRWMSEFMSFCPGRARSITRVINIYNISRHIAFSKNMHLIHEANVFHRKLMKSILLAQFWPMPLACTIHAIEDCLQDEAIMCDHDDKKSWNHDDMPRNENKMNSIFKSIFNVQKREDILELHISRVYQHLIMPLLSIVESDNAKMTDGDPQLFQHLLQEQDPILEDGLKVRDLISANEMVSLSVQSVRPYIFNLQSYMVERIARSINNVILCVKEKNGSVEIAYDKKSDYFANN